MKTLGHIIIILTVFAIVMGATYAVVNAGGSSSNGFPQFENGGRPQFENGSRPEFNGQFEGRPEGGGERGGGWVFGLIKNLGIVAVVTALIAVPRSWMKNKKPAQTVSE